MPLATAPALADAPQTAGLPVAARLPVPAPALPEAPVPIPKPLPTSFLGLPKGPIPVEQVHCLGALGNMDVTFERLPPLEGEAPCGTEVPIKVSALPGGVALKPAAVLNCAMARTLAGWTHDVLLPAAEEELGAAPAALRVASSYVCRRVNNSKRGKLSQHAFANAIDISAIVMEDTDPLPVRFRGHPNLPPKTNRAGFQRRLREGACERFMTVIGPGGDAFHGDHFHFDLSPRDSGYKVCN